MKRLSWLQWCAGFCLALLLNAVSAQGLVAVPPLQTRVTDLTGTLDTNQKASLEHVLETYETERGSQIFVLMLPSTAPEPIEMFSIRVADAWKAGRKGIDDGVIVVIAKNNPSDLRRMRLEVGRGLEGSLTDAMSKRILQDVMAPHFRQNDFYGGLSAGVAAIQATIDKEALPAPERRAASGANDLNDWLSVAFVTFIIAMFLIRAMARGGRRGMVVRPGRGHVVTGGLGGLGGLGGIGHGGFGGRGGGGFGGGFGGGGGGGFSGGGASGNW
ncbi:MAG TPA: YgcG family protein [Burkholderiaceae bacterium]|nr:YgcG family protein [Burkholderiaceae bacterium]